MYRPSITPPVQSANGQRTQPKAAIPARTTSTSSSDQKNVLRMTLTARWRALQPLVGRHPVGGVLNLVHQLCHLAAGTVQKVSQDRTDLPGIASRRNPLPAFQVGARGARLHPGRGI